MSTAPAPTTSAASPAAPPPASGAPPASTGTPPAAAAPVSAISQALADAPKETAAPPPPAEGDKKPADAKKPEGEKAAALELKVPEGFEADATALDSFKATAAELGLDTPKAQKLFDQYVALETARNAASEKAYADQDAKWAAELKADPEIGGAKLPATIQQVRGAVGYLGKDFAQLLAGTGFGNHPVIVKALAKLGRGIGDDTISGTQKPASGDARLSDAELFYGPPPSASKEQ